MTAGRPRVLCLTPRFPFPADRGDRLHAHHVVRTLASRFDVTLGAFVDPARDVSEGRRLLEGWGVRLITPDLPLAGRMARLGAGLFSSRPLQVAYYDDPAMHARLQAIARAEPPFDALVCHLIRSAPLERSVRARLKVISLCDSLALGLERRLANAPWLERPSVWLEAGRVRKYEDVVLDRFDEGWVVSDVDRAAFRTAADRIVVVPNGVGEALFEGEIPESPPPVVGFLGHLGVPHNVDAVVFLARCILPVLRARGLVASVRIIGAEPAPAVRALADLPGVELAGYAQDLSAALRGLRVLCAPLRFSSGVQNKLIEAVAAGVPAVSSGPAVDALGPEARSWIAVADDAEAYAAAIESLWTRTPERRQQIEGARAWARRRFRWVAYAERLEELLARPRPLAPAGRRV
jgi:glycosyltransferase involved in cell wall biosynthesis